MTNTSTFIIPTSLKNSCYDFKIEHNGRNCYAELTYNLNDSPPTRRLLRLKERDALSLFPDLNNNREFQQIRSQIKDLQVRGIGNMSIAKGLVLEQYQSTFNNPELGIAVHRMGPVPVFLLPEKLIGPLEPIQIYEQQLQPTIGIYSVSLGSDFVARSLNKGDLLRSYGIQLDVVLLKYLEDTGEHFHDIENYLPRINVYSRAKQIETTLQQSIESKVEDILQYYQTEENQELHRLARVVWEKYSSSIITAALARVYALFLINELYRFLGVADKSRKYEGDWGRFTQIFRTLYGDNEFEQLFQPGSDLSLLREARSNYVANSEDLDFEALHAQAISNAPRWVQNYVSFTRFIASLRRESPNIGTGRIFISLQHNVDAASNFYQSVTAYINNQPNLPQGLPLAQVLTVNDEGPGPEIERLVKSRIWLSDTLLAVIPKDWEDRRHGDQKDLTWIVKEVDHGLLLERLLDLFIEETASRERIINEFSRDIRPLSPSNHRYAHRQRKDRRIAFVQKNLNASFNYRADIRLDDNLKRQIDLLIKRTRERHARDVLVGFIYQFEDPQFVAQILHLARYPQSKKWICDHIANERRQALIKSRIFPSLSREAKKQILTQINRDIARYLKRVRAKFDNTRKGINQRRLMIHGQTWNLLSQSGPRMNTVYKSNLPEILRALMPDETEDRLDKLHDRVFNLVQN